MAAFLKRHFELLALKATPRSHEGVRGVALELQHFGLRDGCRDLGALSWDGVPGEAAETRFLHDVRERVEGALEVLRPPPELPLWLHLAKPYGRLGALPWEAALETAAGRTVLRLPDFLERPREEMESLDVAICCDVTGPAALRRVASLVEETLSGSPRRRTSVWVFAREANARRLGSRYADDPRVRIFAPALGRAPRVVSPWFAGMSDALAGRPVDMVHFVCRGAEASDRPSLKLADPAVGSARIRYASVREVSGWLTTLGAWAAAFTPVDAAASDRPLRLFADAFAQERPGAVLYAPDGAVADRIAFLFAPAPVPSPRLDAGFLYCQPGIAMMLHRRVADVEAVSQNALLFEQAVAAVGAPVAGLLAKGVAALSGIVREYPALAGLLEGASPSLPSWVAAAQRFVEASALTLLREGSSDALLADRLETFADRETGFRGSYSTESDIVKRTLADLQRIVAYHASGRRDLS